MIRFPDDAPCPATQPQAYADYLFDAVSEGLRDAPDPLETLPSPVPGGELWPHVTRLAEAYWRLRADFAASDQAFSALHEWIADGGPMPGPWREPRDNQG